MCVFDVGVCDRARPDPARPLCLLASDAIRLRRWLNLMAETLRALLPQSLGVAVECSRQFYRFLYKFGVVSDAVG